MIGDSITDCGRARPVGQGPSGALGNGYVSLVDGLINATYPGGRLRIINTGISGNTVRDLKARWQNDVLDLEPDWLSIMIGINDVWRHFDSWTPSKRQVSLDEYTNTLEALVRTTRPSLQGLVLMTPYFIEPDRAEAMRVMMDRYGDAVRALARQYGSILVDTQAAFDEVLPELPPTALAEDRVHPNLTGHVVLARAFLKAVGYRW
ncbi:MAG: SGNH/GDSL hydrolase family protein [Chloroflexi bacterium]|nr:SGNH/GDSL hydrolase family protein [Chloroflexota bacterium]MCI0574848.1 SGNH/GDSL hydrolase family protein [Chloroflexota bacterium]MCI0645934.1 SGNH/GDSL hydrolase family protein [Chloroflexota bacterium]MCI0726897.1 SGNH/GDSL hydrolase family protein [Chloroflexota bacterium]